MTAFDIDANINQVEDPAFTSCTGPVLVDASSLSETYQEIYTTAGARGGSTTDPANYNYGPIQFLADVSQSTRVRLDKSYLRIEYEARQIKSGTAYALNSRRCSIPWNTIAATIANINYKLNASSQEVENLNTEFGHGNMVKILTTYSRDALEEASDRFFTPCLESTRDIIKTDFAATDESYIRSHKWLSTAVADDQSLTDNVIKGSKIMMLSDIFDSMRPECVWFIQRLDLNITFKDAAAILFRIDPAATAYINKFFITRVVLRLCVNTLSSEQVDLETERLNISPPEPVLRISYRSYDTITESMQGSVNRQYQGIKNLQAAVVVIPSDTASDRFGATSGGVNPYQYCYGCSIVSPITGVTSYYQRYDNFWSPATPILIDTQSRNNNTDLYEMWRYLCRVIQDRRTRPNLEFGKHIGQALLTGATLELNPYVMFTSVFCNQDTAARKLVAGGTHEIIIAAPSTNLQPIFVVRIGMRALEISSDTSVHIMR